MNCRELAKRIKRGEKWEIAPMSDTPLCDAMFAAYGVIGDKPEARAVRDLERSISDGSGSWVPTSERLPEVADDGGGQFVSDIVIVHWPTGWIGNGMFVKGEGWMWMEQDEGQLSDADPTHWMPMPKAPK